MKNLIIYQDNNDYVKKKEKKSIFGENLFEVHFVFFVFNLGSTLLQWSQKDE